MACAVWTAYRVSLLLIGLCFVGFTVNMVNAAKGGEGPPRSVAALNDQHRQLCPLISNCTRWCSDCSLRLASNLYDSFEETCPNWSNEFPTGYRYLVRCTDGYEACFCAISDSRCRRCEYSKQNKLACFSQDNDGNIVFTPLSDSDINGSYLALVCPRCSCSTDKPTTPEAPTTQRKMQTRYFGDRVAPRPNENAMTTAAGDAAGPDKVVVIAAAVGGCALLILLIVTCVCLWRRCVMKQPKNKEEEYVYIEEMQTMRSQASMMNSTNLTSNDRIYPPCGHRHFNNEMYNLNGVTNGPSSPDIPPELPGNHPPPLAPYQELNRGSRVRRDVGNTAMGSGPCPHCRQMANDRSATAPLLDTPRGAEEGSKNPYMALLKNNTCPTPTAPPQEPICTCHARPLSECSSVLSDQHDSSSQAASTLNSVGHESNPRPTSSSEIQESPYYFKMKVLDEEDISSPKSPEYFKLEDAQTLPLDSEITPMLNSNPDPNANDLHLKSISDDSDVGPPDILRKEQLPNPEEGSEKANDNSKQSPNISSDTEGMHSESTPKGRNFTDSLPKGDYMHAITT